MIALPGLFLIVLCLAVPVHWACVGPARALRPAVVILTSLTLTFLLNPLVPLVTLAIFAATWGSAAWAGADSRRRRVLARGAWAVFGLLGLPALAPGDVATRALLGHEPDPALAALAWLGLSYSALRAFLILRETALGRPFEPAAALNSLTFFGAFAAGPIVGAGPYLAAARRPTLTLDRALTAVARIGWGAALVLIAAPAVREAAVTGGAQFGPWIPVWLNFLALYLDFAGYCDVAIGAAALFGVTLPENFRLPLLATSIQAFWQRWHLTLGAVISTWLFKPLVRATGRPGAAIFLAFAAVGLWHATTPGYVLWGLGHGAALAIHMKWGRRLPRPAFAPALWGTTAVAWAATLSYVSLLSAVAGAGDLDSIGRLMEALLGL